MKKITLIISAFSIALIVLTSFVIATKAEENKPKATYQVGSSKVIVWENKKSDGTTWKNFEIEKVYKKGEKWKSTNKFNETELLELKTALEKAISEETVIKK